MPTKKTDSLAEKLNATAGPAKLTGVERIFGDRPEVLEAIKSARRDRKLSYQTIATTLSTEADISISDGAVRNWLSKNGIT